MRDKYAYHPSLLLLYGILIPLTLFFAIYKAFWYDELFSLRIAETRLGWDMWQAITAGFEFNPPAVYLAISLSESLFGRGEITSRLPFLVAGWTSVYFLYLTVARRLGWTAGIAGAILWLSTDALSYFYEARPYAFVLLAATIILYSLSRQESRLRFWGIFFGLLLAVLSHFWAIVLIPLLCLHLGAQYFSTKTVDRPLLFSLLLSLPALAIYKPLIASNRGVRFDNVIFKAGLKQAFLLNLDQLPLVLFFLLLLLLALRVPLTYAPSPDRQWFAWSLISAPILIGLATALLGSANMVRYSLLLTIGVVMSLTPFLSAWMSSSKRQIRIVLLGSLFALLLGSFALKFPEIRAVAYCKLVSNRLSRLPVSPQAIVFEGGLDFVQQSYYANASTASRFHFVADRAKAILYTGSDGVDSALLIGQPWLKFPNPLLKFEELPSCFWLLRQDHPLSWVGVALQRANYRLEPGPPDQKGIFLACRAQERPLP